MGRRERRMEVALRDAQKAAQARVDAQIPAHVRAELDQTPEWWDAQYRALVAQQIPRDAASHDNHDIEEPITFWSGGYAAAPYCVDCGVSIERPPDG